MFERDTDRDWQRYGAEDPYYGVVSDDRFHKNCLDESARNAFFKTGEEHVTYLFDVICKHMLPDFSPERILDFGCGVGRCTIPFSRFGKDVVGIDVSEDMIREARTNASTQKVNNVQFVASASPDEALQGKFDLIHSFIVFQHIPQPRGEVLLTQLVNMLSADGVGVFHFLYHTEISSLHRLIRGLRKRIAPLHWVANVLHKKPLLYPLMEKNEYDLNRLFFVLRRLGCGEITLRMEGVHSMHGIMIFFRRKRDLIPYNRDQISDS